MSPTSRRWSLTFAVVLTAGAAGCAPSSDQPAPLTADTTAASTDGQVSSALPRLPKFGDPAAVDSGPPLAVQRTTTGARLEVNPRPGDQINALLPPFIETDDGRRLQFEGPAVTEDSAYFVGAVTTLVADSLLPLRGTLHTSYCKAGERLCRSARRAVQVDTPND